MVAACVLTQSACEDQILEVAWEPSKSAFTRRSSSPHPELTCVLDLDECLLHSKFHGAGSAAKHFRQEEYRPEDIQSNSDTFWLKLDDGEVQVNKRPGLDAFLEALARMARVIVFTAAMPDYAGPVLDVLDPTGKLFHRRLYRSSCRQVRGAFLKDLTVLGSSFASTPGRVILLDNNPCSFLCQPTNGILITSYYDDAQDTALASVLQLVQHLDQVPDVRPILRDMFRLEVLLREYHAALFPEGDSGSAAATGSSCCDNLAIAAAEQCAAESTMEEEGDPAVAAPVAAEEAALRDEPFTPAAPLTAATALHAEQQQHDDDYDAATTDDELACSRAGELDAAAEDEFTAADLADYDDELSVQSSECDTLCSMDVQ